MIADRRIPIWAVVLVLLTRSRDRAAERRDEAATSKDKSFQLAFEAQRKAHSEDIVGLRKELAEWRRTQAETNGVLRLQAENMGKVAGALSRLNGRLKEKEDDDLSRADR